MKIIKKSNIYKWLVNSILYFSIIYWTLLILQNWIEKFISPKIFIKISLTYGILIFLMLIILLILKDIDNEDKLKKDKYLSD